MMAGGDKALEILDHLAQRQHFNLVVVHTKGYVDSLGYDEVLRDILCHLQKPPLR